ncbi:Uncharacterised protein [Escherichia coli]|nr:Uncharacterised protein [Escherichia coli]
MKLGFIGLGIMVHRWPLIWRVPVINYMSRPLDRLLMNYCHWVPSVLKLLAR